MRCYIFDIDGTLADIAHRLHFIQGERKDWRAFFAACVDDKPIEHVCNLAIALSPWDDHNSNEIVFVSGRSDEVRSDTLAWLQHHVGPVRDHHLFMTCGLSRTQKSARRPGRDGGQDSRSCGSG